MDWCFCFFWATVCETFCRMLSDCCPVLSVMLVYCGQTVGWIKMKLGMQVGLGPGHVVLDGYPASPPSKGHSPPIFIFGPYLLWPNGWMDQDGTWHVGRPRPRPHCARWGCSSPPQKWGTATHPQFSVHVYCGQTAGWIKMAFGMEVDSAQATLC